MPAAGQAQPRAPQGPRIIGTVVAIFMAVVMIPVGLLIAMSQALNLKFLEGVVEVQPGAEANFLGLFGLFIFGVGLAMLLTQVFAEKYSAKLSGLTFAGTLAALLLFMLIARYTVFDIDPSQIETPTEQKRALSLQIQCPPTSGESTAARRAFIMIVPGIGAEAEVREAFASSPEHERLIVDPSLPEFDGLDIPRGALLLAPEFGNDPTFAFDLPAVIHSRLRSQMTVFSVALTGSAASSELSSAQRMAEREIATIMFRPQFPSPKIEASIDFSRVREVCGV